MSILNGQVVMAPDNISTLQMFTFAIAVLGAVLGLINTWQAIDRTRVKFRVRPMHAIPVGGANRNLQFCIEVTNLSAFAITITDAGLHYVGTKTRGTLFDGYFHDGPGWPRRLEPRTSVTVYGARPESSPGRVIRRAYATTQCGVTKTGNSGALKQMAAGPD